MGLHFVAVMLVLGVLGRVQACSPVFGWEPKTLPELVTLAPITARIKISDVEGDLISGQTAAADVKCVIKNTSGSPVAKHIKITGFGDSSLCLVDAEVGERALAFLDIVSLDTKPPTYKLVYSDIHAGTYPDTRANVADAMAAVLPDQLIKADTEC
jgi:hypothetical protein